MIKKYVNVRVYNKEYTVVVEVDPKTGAFVGYCKQYSAVMRQGKTMHELFDNLKTGIKLAVVSELTDRKAQLEALAEVAKLMDATVKKKKLTLVKKNTITMEEIVAEVKKVRSERKD